MKPDSDINYFSEIFDSYYEKIVSFLYHYCKERESAENIAQDTFVTFWENIDKIDREHPPLPYLYFIAKNKALNIIKRDLVTDKYNSYIKHREVEISYKALQSLTMSQVQVNELRKVIGESLDKMNSNTAQTFRLSRFGGLKNAEIAQELNVSIKTVEYRLMCALRILQDNLKEFLILFVFINLI